MRARHSLKGAQRHEIVELGFSAVGPVLDVMGVRVAVARAAGEAAAAITAAPPRASTEATVDIDRRPLAARRDA
jgi:hypothetical protein